MRDRASYPRLQDEASEQRLSRRSRRSVQLAEHGAMESPRHSYHMHQGCFRSLVTCTKKRQRRLLLPLCGLVWVTPSIKHCQCFPSFPAHPCKSASIGDLQKSTHSRRKACDFQNHAVSLRGENRHRYAVIRSAQTQSPSTSQSSDLYPLLFTSSSGSPYTMTLQHHSITVLRHQALQTRC